MHDDFKNDRRDSGGKLEREERDDIEEIEEKEEREEKNPNQNLVLFTFLYWFSSTHKCGKCQVALDTLDPIE